MTTNYSPKIINNGLVVYLDAANIKSYPGSGTTWNDLSGNGNNGTLTLGPTYSSSNKGYMVFDGVDDYVLPTAGLTDSFWQSNWTASYWVKFNVINTDQGPTDRNLTQHGSNTTRQGLHLDQRLSVMYFGLYADDLGGITVLQTGTWYNIVCTLNNSNYQKQIYINGKLDASHIGTGPYIGTGNNTKICGVTLFGLTFGGFMSSCSFYNKVLSESEIIQNYNALKGRYGL